MMNQGREDYSLLLEHFGKFSSTLSKIPRKQPDNPQQPYFENGWIGGTNAVAMYCLPAIHKSKRYIEVGSGNSTKFVRQSILDNHLATRITSIDPEPRSDIDEICDDMQRLRLENADLAVFGELAAGDIICMDGSHRCFQNSDVTVFFLEVLPRLPCGVLIYIDDIYLPYDYPPEWLSRYYSEQYVLAALLLADAGRRYRIVLPHNFVERDPELSAKERQLWSKFGHSTVSCNGLWIEVV